MRAVVEILRAYTEVLSGTCLRVEDQQVGTTFEADSYSYCKSKHCTVGTPGGRTHTHYSIAQTDCLHSRLRQT